MDVLVLRHLRADVCACVPYVLCCVDLCVCALMFVHTRLKRFVTPIGVYLTGQRTGEEL